MPSRPVKATELAGPTGAHVVNQNFREVEGRLDDIQKVLNKRIGSASTLTFGSIASGACKESSAYITGANQNLVAHANPAVDVGSNLHWSARIIGANLVAVRVCNPSASPVTPHVVKWQIVVR
jgi:hypothetical protein